MIRLSETVYVVARPDGTSTEFSDASEADAARAATPGSQLRTVPRERDVLADYVVMVGDTELSRHKSPGAASSAARSVPDAYVMLLPEE